MHGILFLFACEWDAFGLFVLSKGGKFGLRFSIGGVFEGGSGCARRVLNILFERIVVGYIQQV